jgi:hypothetical protein
MDIGPFGANQPQTNCKPTANQPEEATGFSHVCSPSILKRPSYGGTRSKRWRPARTQPSSSASCARGWAGPGDAVAWVWHGYLAAGKTTLLTSQ